MLLRNAGESVMAPFHYATRDLQSVSPATRSRGLFVGIASRMSRAAQTVAPENAASVGCRGDWRRKASKRNGKQVAIDGKRVMIAVGESRGAPDRGEHRKAVDSQVSIFLPTGSETIVAVPRWLSIVDP